MAEANWGPGASQAVYSDSYDQGFAPVQRSGHIAPGQTPGPSTVSPPTYIQTQTGHTSPPVIRSNSYVHPAHGGPQPVAPHPTPQQPWQAHQHAHAEHIAPMAALDQDYAPEHDPVTTETSRGASGILNYAGAALSLALIAGLAVWGYDLAVRDVTGVPVVRALEGPMRVQPADPGGQNAAHQGLAVNEVQAEGTASGAAERIVLAPGAEELTQADVTAKSEVAAEASEISPVRATPEQLPADPVAAALALAEQLADQADPLTGETVDEEVVASVATTEPAQAAPIAPEPVAVEARIIPASVPGVRLSPRPAGRPADLNTVAPITPVAAAAPAQTSEVAAETIPAGTRLVQLGAFDSADVARTEWDKLAVRFEDYLSGKSRVIQKAQSGGKTFYRLRATGFTDLADARRFCSVLMAAKAACIPVVSR